MNTSTSTNDGQLDEASLVKLYMDLTGSSEASARNVYMFIHCENGKEKQKLNGLDRWRTQKTEAPLSLAKESPAQTDGHEFGIGLLGREGLVITGK